MENRSLEIVFRNDGTSERQASLRVRLQSEAGVQSFGVVSLPYQKNTEKVDIDYVRVRKPDGSVVSTALDDVQDVDTQITREAPLYSDSREKHIAVKGMGVGDLLEYQAHWHVTKPLAQGQFWQTFDFADDGIFLHDELQISVPRERAIKWKSEGLTPVITEAGDLRKYVWSHAQLISKTTESKKKAQELLVYQASIGQIPQPAIQVTSFASWEEVGKWYSGLQADRMKRDAEVRAKALELTKGLPDDEAKIRALYRYVSLQFRYVGIDFGIGRYQPHPASEVLGNQYGDCKDKHTLFAALLAAIDIPAFPALVNSSHALDTAVPSPAQFDHVITAIPRGDHILWLDTTPEVAPFGYLLSTLRGKTALVMPTNKPPFLTQTVGRPPAPSLETFRLDGKLDEAGTLEAKIERTAENNDGEVVIRYAFRRVPRQQWKDLAQQTSYAANFFGDVSEVTASAVEKPDEPFGFTYHYTRKEFPDFKNQRVSSALPTISLPTVSDGEAKPDHPIRLGAPGEFRYESHIELPKGYLPGLPKKLDLVERFAEYHLTYAFKNNVLTTRESLLIKLEEVPDADLETYRTFAQRVQDSRAVQVPLSSGLPSLSSYAEEIWMLPQSSNKKALKAYEDAQGAFGKNDIEGEIASLKRAVQIDPRYLRAWLWLGDIYRFHVRNDDAAQAFRTAISLDPEQTVSYKALGLLLLGTHQLEEAIPVWKELMRIAPDNPAGPFFLGSTLLDLKRCPEAVKAYQTAASLVPEMSFVRQSVGNAQLCAGNTDEALIEYKKVAESDKATSTLNAIAYTLADQNKALDSALEYANQAAVKEGEASRNIKLAALEPNDVGCMHRLAMYWDTLGWVYFRMGRLSEAREYLDASWNLAQFGPTADHLGQLDEKENKIADAIHMYRLALASLYQNPDQSPLTQERLDRLSHGHGNNGGNLKMAIAPELSNMRAYKLGLPLKKGLSAEYFLLLSRDSKTGTQHVDDVKFLSGAEELKAARAAIQSAHFRNMVAPAGDAHVLRRGIVSCSEVSGCSITLLNTMEVQSLN